MFLQARFSMEYLGDVTNKRLAHNLVKFLFTGLLYCSLYSLCPGQDMLYRVKKMCVLSVVTSFFFKLQSRTFPVNPRLKAEGMFAPWSVD